MESVRRTDSVFLASQGTSAMYLWNFNMARFRTGLKLGMLAVTLCLLAAGAATAQVGSGGQPPSFTTDLSEIVPTAEMPPVDVQAYMTEDAQAGKDTPYRFGAPHDVSLNPDNAGVWSSVPGGRVWRLRISSPGAHSINILYDQFHMPEGGEFFVYNDDRDYLIGAFTDYNNKADGWFATQPVPGGAVTLEYYEPSSAGGEGVISIFRVVHAYRNLFGKRALDDYNDSGWCNNNVNCPEGEPWQDEKRGVTMILQHSGYRICSGSMINNARNDFTPYYLTARHCTQGESIGTWIFMFNYESPGCDNQNGPTNQTVVGGTMIAQNAASDFALLEISIPIPLDYNPYYNGWSAEDIPSTESVAIHHPSGDIKKISFDYDAPSSDRYFSDPPDDSHWHIHAWDDGTTEGGSSGSPLFDQNHRITGQLHGGYASCEYNYDDYYGKVAMSWNYGTSPGNRLQDWLDPDGSGILVLDGIDPQMTGRVAGIVQDGTGAPLETVRVAPVDGDRRAYTNESGEYSLPMADGTYDIEFTKFGYGRVVEEDVSITEGDTSWVNVTMYTVPDGALTGQVITQTGVGLANARVVLESTPLDTLTTDDEGYFDAGTLPATDYQIHVEYVFNVAEPETFTADTTITVAAGGTTNVALMIFLPIFEPIPDNGYGYTAYDRYDRDLPAEWNWIELDPFEGGPGTEFEFEHHDSSVFFKAPFPITFYGEAYDSLTVSNNGWMLPGIHHLSANVNCPIPGEEDPPGVIAAFWDDMRSGLGAQQFSWYDAEAGRWIFEFIYQRLVSPGNTMQNWQVHFLDPALHPTATGDGEILYIYGEMEYALGSTIGLEAPDEQSGIQELYNRTLHEYGWPIEYGSAIRLTTGRAEGTGTVAGTLSLYPFPEDVNDVIFWIGGVAVLPITTGDYTAESVPAAPVGVLHATENYELCRMNYFQVAEGTTTGLNLEAWRLDPPRSLDAVQYDGEITLTWQTPESVELHPNPDVRYAVYRDGNIIADDLSETSFIETLEDGQEVEYTIRTRYPGGDSAPSEPLIVIVDLASGENETNLPTRFALHGGYPNPFNASTNILFDLPQASHVILKIYDIAGRQTAVLSDAGYSAGQHTVRWSASEQPSGMYFAVLEAGGQRFTAKMLLLK